MYTLEGYETTRPTLDRVKEALFSKINMELQEAVVLDLFSGCGALGLEAISRGAEKAYLIDSSVKAIKIINQNVEKTKFENYAVVLHDDYLKALEKISDVQFDFVFLDPPYKTDFAVKATEIIIKKGLLKNTGKIIIETDIEENIIQELEKIDLDIFDVKKYGRVTLIFTRRKG